MLTLDVIFIDCFNYCWSLHIELFCVKLLFGLDILSYECFAGLSSYTTEEALSEAFAQFGQVIEGAYFHLNVDFIFYLFELRWYLLLMFSN